MAEYDMANTCFTVLPINVPVLLVGLLPENWTLNKAIQLTVENGGWFLISA
jgi:hypothetical protein